MEKIKIKLIELKTSQVNNAIVSKSEDWSVFKLILLFLDLIKDMKFC